MAVKTLIVRNMSNHDQRFQVHGWNGNKDIVVKKNSEHRIPAADGSSGAIIAVHDGHIGEQAEITKHGFGGNDFIDMSNICGAGGNMIVQQVGDAKTRKGDPRFMQNLNTAWKKASQSTKDGLKKCVHVKDGKVVRIDAPKDYPKLESFIRTFADGKTYIGVGSWNGSPGNANDNNQSSAAHGSKDILICYNDGDCTPKARPRAAAMMNNFMVQSDDLNDAWEEADGEDPQEEGSNHQGGSTLPKGQIEANKGDDSIEKVTTPEASGDGANSENVRANVEALLAAAGGDPSAISPEALLELAKSNGEIREQEQGNEDDASEAHMGSTFTSLAVAADAGPGIKLTNKSKKECTYYFYNNYWNGNGTAGANFDKPLKSVKLKPNTTQFVGLPASFKGRLQRGKDLPCTWVEFQLEASDDHRAHGDISLQQGCDGAATIASTDGTNVINGFTNDVVTNAPAAAIRKKPNGERAIDTTVGNWTGGPNKAAIDYLNKVVGQRKAYILGGSGTPDVASKNKRLAVVMY